MTLFARARAPSISMVSAPVATEWRSGASHVARRDDARLLVIDPGSETWSDRRLADLPALLGPNDVVVVNDAATLPASLPARVGDHAIELRLVAAPHDRRATAVVLGAGDWRTRTEDRPPPPTLPTGSRIAIASGGLAARVAGASSASARLVDIEFDRDGDALWRAIYAAGRPVQYAHARDAYALWDVQTAYASRPWAVEMPSAGYRLSWDILGALALRGVRVVPITHAAGLSSTGDPAIDAALPLPEAYEIPPSTVDAITGARRVIAIGTSVVRALEGAARRGILRAGRGVTDLIVGPAYRPRVVDGVVSGIHAAGESHRRLLAAFGGDVVGRATDAGLAAGYREHEHGDAIIVLPNA